MGIQNKRRAALQPEITGDLDWTGECERCGATISRYRGENDIECPKCRALYNCWGQRLRDDLHTHPNPSEYDDEIGDMEGYEIAMRDDG